MNKKSNLFLLVYGVFLLISAVCFTDEILYKVSLAATISGLLFTFSDFCLDNGYMLKKEINLLKSTSNQFDSIKKSENYMNRIIIIGKMAFIFGVFLFLIITVYYDEKYMIFRVFKSIGNKLTITAFAIVMLNYWIKDWYIDWFIDKNLYDTTDKNNNNPNI